MHADYRMSARWACAVLALVTISDGLFGGVFDGTVVRPALAAEATVPALVPAGVTLVEVVRELSASAAEVLWVRPGDAQGRTLFVSAGDHPDHSMCADACAREFPPLVAHQGATPFGDWTLVRRDDGRMQWSYQTRPLYTWSKEQEAGEVATNVGLTETANSKLAENPVRAGSLMPPDGWEVARIEPPPSLVMPDGIDARMVPSAQAIVLTDFEGHTLYAFNGDARNDGQACASEACDIRWLAVAAPALAFDLGEFSVVTRKDGTRQWAFRTRPLYRYVGDLMAGDVRGLGLDERWEMAAIRNSYRPAGVSVTRLEGYGDSLTFKGMTLYSGSAFQKYWGGRNLRDSFKNAYYKGKKLGGQACADAECLTSWRPLLAAPDAVSTGFWEVIARPDGTKQWAYKGYGLYTHTGDKIAGDHFGQATYAFAKLEGSEGDIERSKMLAEITRAQGGAGIYWNVAKP